MRKTKIVATIGPASQSESVLESMVNAGVDMVRLNFSHGDFEHHEAVVNRIRAISKRMNKYVGILVDLQGPKIRIGKFENGEIFLNSGDSFCIDHSWDLDKGNQDIVSVDYANLASDVRVGDFLLLNDGLISVKVEKIVGTRVYTRTVVGGELKSSKGINVRGGGLSADALTEKDKEDLKSACILKADYLALSFVRSAEDIRTARSMIESHQGNAAIIAKIERKEALDVLDSILEESDGVMVARGDLALEIGDAQVPIVQKQIIARARMYVRPVIVATQMMESMIVNKTPTRAETSDVANATLDGCDAVMLSAETAIGSHPAEVVQSMARICNTVEKSKWWIENQDCNEISQMCESRDGFIAWSAAHAAKYQGVGAIVSLTESGTSALRISRYRFNLPVFGLCQNQVGLGRMTLYRGVYPIYFGIDQYQSHQVSDEALKQLCDMSLIEGSESVVITKGDSIGVPGQTNSMKILSWDERRQRHDSMTDSEGGA